MPEEKHEELEKFRQVCKSMTNHKKLKVALFPCKVNPPHIGHIITLLRIKEDYNKIIIDILDADLLISAKEAIFMLKEILDNFPDKFEYRTHKISYTKIRNLSKFPKCDVVVTGNKKLYKNLGKLGANVRLVDRVPVYRSRYIREAYIKGLKSKNKKTFSLDSIKNKINSIKKVTTKVNGRN